MKNIHVSITSPYGKVFDGEAQSVVVPGSEGEFGIYPGHCDMLSSLKHGVIELTKIDGRISMIAINWGDVLISDNYNVNIVVSGAVFVGGDTEGEIADAISKANELLRSASDDNVTILSTMSRLENAVKGNL